MAPIGRRGGPPRRRHDGPAALPAAGDQGFQESLWDSSRNVRGNSRLYLCFRDFKDTVFTFLRIILRLFHNFLIQEDVCLFLRGHLTVSFNQYPWNPLGEGVRAQRARPAPAGDAHRGGSGLLRGVGQVRRVLGAMESMLWQKPCWQIYAHGLHGYVGAGARVAPLESTTKTHNYTLLVLQPVHLHQHTRAARARKSADMVAANTGSILPRFVGREALLEAREAGPRSRLCSFRFLDRDVSPGGHYADVVFGRGDDTVGSPRRAQISQVELKFLKSSFSSLSFC